MQESELILTEALDLLNDQAELLALMEDMQNQIEALQAENQQLKRENDALLKLSKDYRKRIDRLTDIQNS